MNGDDGKVEADGENDLLSNGSTPAGADAALAEVNSFKVAFGKLA
jgi:hypothetical protein